MYKSSFFLRELGYDSSPLNILSETSSTPQVLLDWVKPIWVGAQGDRDESSVDSVGTPVNGSMSTKWRSDKTWCYLEQGSNTMLNYWTIDLQEMSEIER